LFVNAINFCLSPGATSSAAIHVGAQTTSRGSRTAANAANACAAIVAALDSAKSAGKRCAAAACRSAGAGRAMIRSSVTSNSPVDVKGMNMGAKSDVEDEQPIQVTNQIRVAHLSHSHDTERLSHIVQRSGANPPSSHNTHSGTYAAFMLLQCSTQHAARLQTII
jgi:hypothetical protein